MSFLTPLFLLLGLLAGPIILLYMLRLRRRQVLVSSTLLWQKLVRDREANAPWQRLRRNLLLILQLIILAALVLALARPFLPVPSVFQGSVVVLLDGSASMLATDIVPDRFSVARRQVSELIADLSGSERMTLILVGQTPEVLSPATGDRSELHRVLEQARAGPYAADWQAALALAAGASQGFREARIVIVSDGGLSGDLPTLPVEAIYLPVGASAENLAISALATADTEGGSQLFASVANYGRLERQALLSLDLEGALFDSRRISVPAAGNADLTWDLPAGVSSVSARLSDLSEDYLAHDNTAWAVPAGGGANRILIVTQGNRFLETVFTLLPGVEVFRADPDSDLARGDGEPFDLYVYDSVALPNPLPVADLLIIHPAAGQPEGVPDNGFIRVSGVFSNTNAIRLADSSLLRFVDWSTIHIRQSMAVEAPWAQSIVTAEGGPLLLAGERGGHRIVILPFRLQESDLPLQIAFPVLMANITGWLNPGQAFDAKTGLQTGDAVVISPGASTTAVVVRKPDGDTWLAEHETEEAVFVETDQLGLYHVMLREAGGERPAGSFAVNLFDPRESNIGPAQSIEIGHTVVEQAGDEDVGQQELWPWLAAAAFLILLLEWWIHHRGARLPRIAVDRLFSR